MTSATSGETASSSRRWHRCSIGARPAVRPGHLGLPPLRRQGVITRLPGTFRYQLTPVGRTVAMLFTKAYGRVLPPGLSVCDAKLPANVASRSPCSSLATPWRHLDRELDNFIDS